MSDRARTLSDYSRRAKASVQGPEAGAIVIGNEAADLDSMVSAILYGLFASVRGAPGAPPVVAVINCPRADFVLRTEAVYLFHAVGLDVDELSFVDEIDLDGLYRAGRLRLTLVDHNVLSADQEKYAGAVEAIIDHHQDGGLYPDVAVRRIEPVGSAATLVAEAILRDEPTLLDAQTATLLLGTILLDTVDLDPAAGRVTPKDRAVVARLVPIAGANADGLFGRLQAEKFDVSALGTDDLLRKDYKAWDTPSGTYAVSTVLTSLEKWVAKEPRLAAQLDAFLRSRGLVCLLAMLAYSDATGAFRRELAVYAPERTLAAELTAMLEACDLELDRIRPAGLSEPERVACFAQRNTEISRKKLQPRLHRFFSGRGEDSRAEP